MHCVDLGESFPTHIYLQNLASIQPRTSPFKYARSPRTDPPGIFTIPMEPVEEVEEIASDEGKVVWTLETEGGQIYAVFFDDMLQEQVLEAETSESAYPHSSFI